MNAHLRRRGSGHAARTAGLATTLAIVAIGAGFPGPGVARAGAPAVREPVGEGASGTRTGGWDVEIGAGLVLFDPSVEKIPKGSSETAVDVALEAALGRRLSSRLTLWLSGAFARGTDTRWESASEGGRADIPTPGISSVFASLESSLLTGPLIPLVGVGAGIVRFGEVVDDIRFEFPSSVETSRIRFPASTDGAVIFDLGLLRPAGPGRALILRYRLLSVFSGDQVNTIDRVILAARASF